MPALATRVTCQDGFCGGVITLVVTGDERTMSDLIPNAAESSRSPHCSGAIPPITDPLGRYWKQPSKDDIAIDETHAMMTRATFDKLHSYNTSTPSGVYPGKMWKAYRFGKWWLRWFGDSGPDMCTNNHREIELI